MGDPIAELQSLLDRADQKLTEVRVRHHKVVHGVKVTPLTESHVQGDAGGAETLFQEAARMRRRDLEAEASIGEPVL